MLKGLDNFDMMNSTTRRPIRGTSPMAADRPSEPIARVAEALDISEEELTAVAVDLFGQWLSGRRRFPTLSQQNQEWYRTILAHAGKSNPSREDLTEWFGLPRGTAQYLAGTFYDPAEARANTKAKAAIADRALKAIASAGDDKGLGANEATFYLSPQVAKSLEALLFETLAEEPMAPPTFTRLVGTTRISFSVNKGLQALCKALGDQGQVVEEAAKPAANG